MRWLAAPAFALSFALVSGGCSYQLDSMFARTTGATTTSAEAAAPRPQSTASMFSPAAIYAAVSEALGKGGSSSASVPWEDPATGARGTVTPLSSAYVQDGTTCRDFLASYVRGSSESWLQGEACRSAPDRWEVRRMRPWRRT